MERQVWGLVDAEKREASLVELLTIGSGFWQGAVSSSRGHTGVLIANRVGLEISEGESFALGPKMRLQSLRAAYSGKGTEKLLTQTPEGAEGALRPVLARDLYTFSIRSVQFSSVAQSVHQQ